MKLAALDLATGERALALGRLRQVVEKYPKDLGARVLIAKTLFMDGKASEALRAAEALIAEEPNAPAATDAHFLIGTIKASTDCWTDAVKSFEEVLRRQPDAAAAQLALARLHFQAQDMKKAAGFAAQVMAARPADVEARALMVRIHHGLKEPARARQVLASLQKEFPNSVRVLNLTAAHDLAEGNTAAAREGYLKASARDPNDLESLAALTALDLSRGRRPGGRGAAGCCSQTDAAIAELLEFAGKAYGEARD